MIFNSLILNRFEYIFKKTKKETIGLICFMPQVVNERNRSAALECVGSVVQPLLVVDFDANWAISTDWFLGHVPRWQTTDNHAVNDVQDADQVGDQSRPR